MTGNCPNIVNDAIAYEQGAQFGKKSIWTEARTERVKELFDSGVSHGEISDTASKEFGIAISRNASIGKAHREGWERVTKPGRYGTRAGPRKAKAKPLAEKTVQFKLFRIVRPNGNPHHEPIGFANETTSIKLRCVDIVPLNLTLAELDQKEQCHYIQGDDHLYCGHPVKPGSSFCVPHHALCWVAPKPKNPPGEYQHWRTAL